MTIEISNLLVETSEDQLKQQLESAGFAVKNLIVQKVVYITLENEADENAVLKYLDNQEISGQLIKASQISDRESESFKSSQGGPGGKPKK